jgi:hypothetical protein
VFDLFTHLADVFTDLCIFFLIFKHKTIDRNLLFYFYLVLMLNWLFVFEAKSVKLETQHFGYMLQVFRLDSLHILVFGCPVSDHRALASDAQILFKIIDDRDELILPSTEYIAETDHIDHDSCETVDDFFDLPVLSIRASVGNNPFKLSPKVLGDEVFIHHLLVDLEVFGILCQVLVL